MGLQGSHRNAPPSSSRQRRQGTSLIKTDGEGPGLSFLRELIILALTTCHIELRKIAVVINRLREQLK